MRAAVMRDWQLRVDDVPDPVPAAGQVLARVLACGICGSDLHMLRYGAEMRALTDELAAGEPPDPLRPQMFDPARDCVMGHEFCCEVVDPSEDSAFATWRRVDGARPLVVFEAVGMPGMIDQAMKASPRGARPGAFEALGHPDEHAKILVVPS